MSSAWKPGPELWAGLPTSAIHFCTTVRIGFMSHLHNICIINMVSLILESIQFLFLNKFILKGKCCKGKAGITCHKYTATIKINAMKQSNTVKFEQGTAVCEREIHHVKENLKGNSFLMVGEEAL